MKKILFVASHRKDRAPNQRFRFEQYVSYLEQNGFECFFSPLIATPAEDKLFYARGNVVEKIPLGMKLALRRLKDVLRANEFDIIFIAREAFITGSSFFEQQLAKRKARIIYDFDDAIWMDVISANNHWFSWLKSGAKTGRIIRVADLVFAGNNYLASYARAFNDNVVVVPTTIDTGLYQPDYSVKKEKITIGWSGSVSTIEHFQHAIPALMLLKKMYGEKIEIKVIGDKNFKNEALGITGISWLMETELQDLRSIDVGIMPLPNNEWTLGKCGLKGLQYMALEIPTVMSPVGVNKEIIDDGFNGYLADSKEDWVEKISLLIENPDLRIQIGKQGRKTVIERFSVESQKELFLRYIYSLIKN